PGGPVCRPWWHKLSPGRWSKPGPVHELVLPPDSALPLPADTAARCDELGPLPLTARVECGSPWPHWLLRTSRPPTGACPPPVPPHTLPHDLFKQFLEQLRFLKPSVPVLGEGGMMRDFLIET